MIKGSRFMIGITVNREQLTDNRKKSLTGVRLVEMALKEI
jgi:hypothetical protein